VFSNKALFAFIYASTTASGVTGPPFKTSVVNNCRELETPF